jgi:hypothetical protein
MGWMEYVIFMLTCSWTLLYHYILVATILRQLYFAIVSAESIINNDILDI